MDNVHTASRQGGAHVRLVMHTRHSHKEKKNRCSRPLSRSQTTHPHPPPTRDGPGHQATSPHHHPQTPTGTPPTRAAPPESPGGGTGSDSSEPQQCAPQPPAHPSHTGAGGPARVRGKSMIPPTNTIWCPTTPRTVGPGIRWRPPMHAP
jgi:hypothetical protein